MSLSEREQAAGAVSTGGELSGAKSGETEHARP
jgi:hypothetical protein